MYIICGVGALISLQIFVLPSYMTVIWHGACTSSMHRCFYPGADIQAGQQADRHHQRTRPPLISGVYNFRVRGKMVNQASSLAFHWHSSSRAENIHRRDRPPSRTMNAPSSKTGRLTDGQTGNQQRYHAQKRFNFLSRFFARYEWRYSNCVQRPVHHGL